MSAGNDREFDRRLSEHLAATLNPQLGRAGRAFEEMIRDADRTDRRRRWNRRRWFTMASGASLIAASVALVLVLWRPGGSGSTRIAVKTGNSPAGPASIANTQVRDVQELVAWRTFDEGVEKIRLPEESGKGDQPLPVHRLRQEAIEQIEWVDPTDRSNVRLLVPRQQVLLIAQETY